VLAPAYNCRRRDRSFVRTGARVRLYDVNVSLRVDTDRIAPLSTRAHGWFSLLTSSAWPRPAVSLLRSARRRGVMLVEDCAQALFSCAHGTPHWPGGRRGHLQLRQDVAVPDGGALVIDRRLARDGYQFRRPPLKATFRQCLPLIKKIVHGFEVAGGSTSSDQRSFAKTSRKCDGCNK